MGYTNPEIAFDSRNYRLGSVRVREEPLSIHIEVNDQRDPKIIWLITGVMYRLVVFQDLIQEYTDPASYSLPPDLDPPADTESDAASLSIVSLSSLLSGDDAEYQDANLTQWRIMGQHVQCVDGVFYEIVTRLVARSDILWKPENLRKVKLPDLDE